MIRSTQIWRHSERGAVAGLRLLSIGVVLLAVATVAIYQFNPDRKPATSTATTTKPPATTTKPPTTTYEPPTTETPTSTTMPPLKCDSNKFALVATPDSPNILPADLRETAENFGKHALIVSPQLCDSGKEKDPEAGLIFIGPFDSSPEACDFKRMISTPRLIPHTTSVEPTTTQASRSPRDSGGSASSSSSVPKELPTPPDLKVHNIRDLTVELEDCEGN